MIYRKHLYTFALIIGIECCSITFCADVNTISSNSETRIIDIRVEKERQRARELIEKAKKVTTADEIRKWALTEIEKSKGKIAVIDPDNLPKYLREYEIIKPYNCIAQGGKKPPYVVVMWGSGELMYGLQIGNKKFKPDQEWNAVEWEPGIYAFYNIIQPGE